MIIEINEDIVTDFLKHHSLEAIFLDKTNNEVKRLIVQDFIPILYLDSFTTPTFKGCSRKLEFRRDDFSLKIEKIGAITMKYRFVQEI